MPIELYLFKVISEKRVLKQNLKKTIIYPEIISNGSITLIKRIKNQIFPASSVSTCIPPAVSCREQIYIIRKTE